MPKQSGIHFEISERKILLRLLDIVFVLLSLYTLELFFDSDYFRITDIRLVSVVVLVGYLQIFGTVFELYDLRMASKFDVTFRNLVLTVSVSVLVYLFTPILTPFLPINRIQVLYFYLAILAGYMAWRLAYHFVIASPRFYKKVLVVGEVSDLQNLIGPLREADPNYHIVGFINCEREHKDPIRFKGLKEFKQEELLEVIVNQKISEIVVATYNSENITNDIYSDLITLLEAGFTIREYTQVFEEITHRVPVQFVGKDFYKYFPFSRSNQNTVYLFFQRLSEILLSILGLIICACLIPFVLIGNAIANRGPLFYRQERVGKNGATFSIVKFRTMSPNAESNGAQWAEKDDLRVTPFGKFLRRTRIDEFPQFINVLKNEMSVIGPRPERPYFVKELSMIIPFYETRHIIKPGLTGWAQVSSRYGGTVDESLVKLQYDLYYIKHRSFWLDLNILVKTFSTILYYRGQ
ncbi:exopolysaccharide biosynthesis polyprenyl glycosylphosphotransferase [Aegicerativicinus sediminis]|uniref:exopolysaccharide biosynthesis polyprenyl glycosylphosphotransferase n=1 Tax=Aegicerativicinus sediminis TaxID=2893202 RepID=UPI001E2C9261|nr:exopolysaccharide biosynthesis polyprenyl glycosylphosphotransferase [Aegicerativicinus sediminis]